ncbi:MAG: hypothetical protein FGM27_00605 [Candidatus Omnitrophica bacterium]|nr:hypothetical protein [Candidatus Omnitrophota bacterium]
MDAEINALVDELRKNPGAAVLTGAGISTDSGIPDYRSQGGLWERYRPVSFRDFLNCEASRAEYWRRKKEFYTVLIRAQPSPAHLALTHLQSLGYIRTVITQNIDGLHQLAGTHHVLEIHGTARVIVCLGCAQEFDFESVLPLLRDDRAAPRCPDCGDLLKPDTVSFGQALDPEKLHLAVRAVQSCRLLICAGTSLAVEPAASLPHYALRAGARVVILNRDATPLDGLAHRFSRGELSPLFKALEEALSRAHRPRKPML